MSALRSPHSGQTKTKVTRLESEIDKCRAEGNWSRALELTRQITTKSTGLEQLANLVLGESKLEGYLRCTRSPMDDAEGALESQEIAEAEVHLRKMLKGDPGSSLVIEAKLLLGKLIYLTGQTEDALAMLEMVDMEKIQIESASNRMLKIMAESYAIKGFCYEKIPPASTSKFKQKEHEDKIVKCFELAGELSILQLQEMDKGQRSGTMSQVGPNSEETMGPILETAIQRSPILYIKQGDINQAIKRFRELIRAVETRATQNLRQTLARQLAEVLLRGVCPETYRHITADDGSAYDQNLATPRKYAGETLFVPRDENEEAILLLLISECMANRDVVLSISPEHKEAREHSFNKAVNVYDLLTILLVRRAQTNLLSETFERAMKFSFEEFHVWYQFALSLICSEKYHRAFLVLQQCTKMQPNNPVLYLQIANLCYFHLYMLNDGIEASKKIIELGDHTKMASRGYVALGAGYALKASESKMRSNRQSFHRRALDAYYKAHSLDKNDHVAVFHLALQFATLRQISDSMKYAKLALKLKPDHVHSLHLVSLLLSAQKQHDEGLKLIDVALEEYPDCINLLFTKSKLEQICLGADEALMTCKQMFRIWKSFHQPADSEQQRGTGLIDKVVGSDKRTLTQLQLMEFSDRDSGSIRAESIAASRVEAALSEVASSMNGSVIRTGLSHSWNLQAQIWLHLAEIYLNEDSPIDALACVNEACSLHPLSHQVSYMKGRVHEYRHEFYEAKKCYDNAISINPAHIRSLQHLGIVLHHLNQDRLAEKVLRDAVNMDPTASQSWHCLGTVLNALNDHDAAAECLFTAVDLESTDPVVPFSSIPRILE